MKTPRLTEVDGFRLPPTFDADTFRQVALYRPPAGRLVVATFPKCGTTWTLQIAMLILRRGRPPASAQEYFSLLPFMEMTPVHLLDALPPGGCLKTHLPFDRIRFSEDVKYIYVARHPADCAVSFYHHMRFFPIYFFSDATFDDFFELFVTGQTDFGDYFDHLLSWYEQRHRPNVFFATFEQLKADPPGMILRMARFLGEEHHAALTADDNRVLGDVLRYSSVDFMRETVDKYWQEGFSELPSREVQDLIPTMKNYALQFEEARKAGHRPIGNFVRKGGVGEGKIVLTQRQRERLEERMRHKCAHSDVMQLWKDKLS